MIRLDCVSFGYNRQNIIFDGFSWEVKQGESWAVLGPSGCGKTTLLYLLAGLSVPQSGEVKIKDEKLIKPRPRTGLILQDYGLLPWKTVLENIVLGLQIRQFYGPDGTHAPEGEVVDGIELIGRQFLGKLGLSAVADQYPGQISGGQRQRTAIARTLALNPDLLLMDEPFGSLDVPTRENLQQFLIDLRSERKITNIIVTHAIEEAAVLGEKILILKAPPNVAPVILLNPSSASNQFVHSDDYRLICRRLRQELGQ
jgi:NitT/TauT family transport system ATP-binding protein